MSTLNEKLFVNAWPDCFILFLAFVEIIAVILLFLTELGNVAANFWRSNVFAGGWSGIVMLIQLLLLLAAGRKTSKE